MRPAAALVFVLGCALLAGACGSSGSSGSSPRASGGAAAAGAQPALRASVSADLARLHQQLPSSTTTIPARWTSPSVDRAYLTAIFDDVQAVWRREFQASHVTYRRARLVFFSGKVDSGCGRAEDSGPFYCPSDSTVYLDLRFFAGLLHEAGGSGAAQAFIVAHEVGHHVQRLLGIADGVEKANAANPRMENARSVEVELQADCLAGVWGHNAFTRSHLNAGDLKEALTAAKVIGDDYIQQAAGDVVDSSMWRHGSSQQRQHWLMTGYESGRPSSCDTFADG